MRDIYVYIDDSGVLSDHSKNEFFIFAGYIFLSEEEKNSAKREYRSLNHNLQNKLNLRHTELKASILDKKYKESLFKIMKRYESMSVSVDMDSLYHIILESKNSIFRYKDFALKLMIKNKILDLIRRGDIDPYEDTNIFIFIDEQNIKRHGVYTLQDNLLEELKSGIINYNYESHTKPIFFGELSVEVEYCDSKSNYLIQASDILANRYYYIYNKKAFELIKQNNHYHLSLP